MKLNSIKQKQLAFKQVNLIQIPKESFENPENLTECNDKFIKKMTKLTHSPSGKMAGFLDKIGLSKRFVKFISFFEFPSCTLGRNITKNNGYSIEWLKQNTGFDFKDAIDENFHSFFVLTKEDKENFIDLTSEENITKTWKIKAKEYANKITNNQSTSELIASAFTAEITDYCLSETIKDKEIHTFKIDKLDDLKEIINKLGY